LPASIFSLFGSNTNTKDKQLATAIRSITGFKPENLELYKLAIRHSSVAQKEGLATGHNERLEYLGDAVLGMIVAEFLFKKFPFKDEGFLTQIRSRIVNGESLNQLSRKVGLDKIIEFEGKKASNQAHKSMYGDALEALVAAVYLDKGFKKCSTFVIKNLLIPHFDLEEVVQTDTNYKSKLIEWAQRYAQEVKFDIIAESGSGHAKEFTAQVVVGGNPIASAKGSSKKRAEQMAAAEAINKLEKQHNK
jgi:ribonuclease-3